MTRAGDRYSAGCFLKRCRQYATRHGMRTQFDYIPTSAPTSPRRASQLSSSSALLKIIGASAPNPREAGKCETRRRRVGALTPLPPLPSEGSKDRCDMTLENASGAANDPPFHSDAKYPSSHAAEPPVHTQSLRKEAKGSRKVVPKSHRSDSTCDKEMGVEREVSDTIRIIKAKLKNLTKKKVAVETTPENLSIPTKDNAPTSESPKKAELREKIETQRQLFKQVIEKGIAVHQENQTRNPGDNSSNVATKKLNDRKVPPLRLRIVRSESGTISYEIVKPKVVLHFKRSLLKSKSIFKITTKKDFDGLEGDLDPEGVENSIKTSTSRSASRKQEPLRSKKVASMPYLASDLMRNSYTVLTACMNGRAHPNLVCEEEARENSIGATSIADVSAKQAVNEVIWQQLFSKEGIIGRQAEKDEKPIRTKN
ncbi:hypothetical protein Y032_0206g1973 [Ancylostoma ceylanicum]|nr:hypothetical protein Y032_0206g1973 [Ancylostoma ceylanicum]